jgi:hypothetical protein
LQVVQSDCFCNVLDGVRLLSLVREKDLASADFSAQQARQGCSGAELENSLSPDLILVEIKQ